jgi:hypothetical protein
MDTVITLCISKPCNESGQIVDIENATSTSCDVLPSSVHSQQQIEGCPFKKVQAQAQSTQM